MTKHSTSHAAPTEEHTLTVEGETIIETDADGNVIAEKDYVRTINAYDRAAHNKRLSHEKRDEDATIVATLTAAHDAGDTEASCTVTKPATHRYASDAAHSGESHEDTVHRHRQIGSLRGQLHREGISEETRKRVEKDLRELGEDV